MANDKRSGSGRVTQRKMGRRTTLTKEVVSHRSEATRIRLLKAAESLFAEKGCHATSVRDMATRAGVNLAAVCYHFGSKERLLVEALARQIRPLNQRRVAALDAVLAKSPKPALSAVLDAFARTMVEESLADSSAGQRLHRLLSRAFAEADEVAQTCFKEELLPTAQRFLTAIALSRPDLSREQAALGMAFYAGCTIHILRWVTQPPLPELKPVRDQAEAEALLKSLVDYGVAGFNSLARRTKT